MDHKAPRERGFVAAPAVLSYAWLPSRVLFKAVTASGQPLHDFEFRGDLSSPGGNPRVNLWLLGQAPRDGKDIHIIVESFSFQAP